MKKFLVIVLALLCMVPMSACKKEEIVYAPIDLPMDEADLTVSEYSISDAEGPYGYYIKDDVKISFFGIMEYEVLENEKGKLKEGEKAVVVGMSAVKLRNNDANINGIKNFLVDTTTNTNYPVKWFKDNDITQFEKKKERSVMCYRLIFAVPNALNIDKCVFLSTCGEDNMEEHLFSHMQPNEPTEEGSTDITNMCPLCSKEEYEKTTLVVCTCPLCGRQYVSSHNPPQEICYACSVMYNRCTQCQRYIEKGIDKEWN